MNTTKFFRSFPQILTIALTLVVLVFGQVVPVSAQSATPPAVAEYAQLSVKGQLIIAAGDGWVAPESMNGLNVTVWYGVKTDTVASMANLGNVIAQDRARNYGGSESDYPTVVWSGITVAISGNNCRPEFYSDATILTAGVVYGDQCPLLIEYNAEGHIVAAPTMAAAIDTVVPTSTALPTSTPTATVSPTPTISVEASVTPGVTPTQTAAPAEIQPTDDPSRLQVHEFRFTDLDVLWIVVVILILVVIGMGVALFRRR